MLCYAASVPRFGHSLCDIVLPNVGKADEVRLNASVLRKAHNATIHIFTQMRFLEVTLFVLTNIRISFPVYTFDKAERS